MSVNELFSLEGRSALVTGASGGIGRVISKTILDLGGDLIAIDHPDSDIELFISELKDQKPKSIQKISAYHCDLESEESRIKLIQEIFGKHDSLSILVNNAAFVGARGLKGWVSPFPEQSLETWRRAIEVNLTAPFHLSQGLAPLLMASTAAGGSTIINIASIYGQYGPDWRLYQGLEMGNPAAYAASKGGLIQLTKWLATTLAPSIRVNAISPGGIKRGQPSQFVDKYEAKVPLERMAVEGDLIGAIAYLSGAGASYVTGQVISVDGGWGVW
jgi:NAD(P)-dependent dehydrogenase (short-subunit alcohol dehydrogenase family)